MLTFNSVMMEMLGFLFDGRDPKDSAPEHLAKLDKNEAKVVNERVIAFMDAAKAVNPDTRIKDLVDLSVLKELNETQMRMILGNFFHSLISTMAQVSGFCAGCGEYGAHQHASTPSGNAKEVLEKIFGAGNVELISLDDSDDQDDSEEFFLAPDGMDAFKKNSHN